MQHLQKFNNGDPRMNRILKVLQITDQLPPLSTTERGISIIGFPSDLGTVRNKGRAGGYAGPEAFRRFINTKGPLNNPELQISLLPTDESQSQIVLVDRGNVIDQLKADETSKVWDNTLEKAHELLHQAVFDSLNNGYVPFCIGGSNDQSYPNASALIRKFGASNVSVMNIDAHLDVRPLEPNPIVESGDRLFVPHSGSPFRLLLEHEGFVGSNFEVFAAQGMQCSSEHTEYIYQKGGKVTWLGSLQKADKPIVDQFIDSINRLSSNGQQVFISFDIDSVRSSDCPGVSCPSPIGLSSDDALAMAFAAGKHPNVSLFDLSELCPVVENYRSPMLAAYMFYHFALGYSQRP